MAQSLVVTVNKNPFMDGTGPFTIICDWVSASDGTVSLNIASTFTTAQALLYATPVAPTKIQGRFLSCQTIPGRHGDKTTNVPTAYTIKLLDKYGDDLLAANGTNRSASVSDRLIQAGGKMISDTEITLTITGAGSGAEGRAVLEFDEQDYLKA